MGKSFFLLAFSVLALGAGSLPAAAPDASSSRLVVPPGLLGNGNAFVPDNGNAARRPLSDLLLPAQEGPAPAQVLRGEHGGIVLMPTSSLDGGEGSSHTHLYVLAVPAPKGTLSANADGANGAPGGAAYASNTPAMIRSAYGLPASGGGAYAIAIVEAYHAPTALADFNAFAAKFGLPVETSTNPAAPSNTVFQAVYPNGSAPAAPPAGLSGWNVEAALDIEWAHALAPNAKIYLVEAADASGAALFQAVEAASRLPKVREVSMSWGGAETAQERLCDPIFTAPGIVYLASSGDVSDAVQYPAASPNVIGVGGTTLARTGAGLFLSETAWGSGGCGLSAYEPRPAYQGRIADRVGNRRGVADLSFDADPESGFVVYSKAYGWIVVGGTSAACPCVAAILNAAGAASGGYASGTAAEQARIYEGLGDPYAFRDVSSGADGIYRARIGWDFGSGVGSPVGYGGK